MSGAILRRRDRTARSLRVVHYSSAVNMGTNHGGGQFWTPITPNRGSIFHADQQLAARLRSTPPTIQLGGETVNALTFTPDQ